MEDEVEQYIAELLEAERRGPSPGHLAARRMMEMVGSLHERGLEGLRLHAGLAPSGCYWRGGIYPARAPQAIVGPFSTGAEAKVLFDWVDAELLDVPALAERFLVQFGETAALGRHADAPYATWYREMLALTAPHGLVYFAADFELPPSGVGVSGPGDVARVTIPKPPP